jgi:Sec-independent protein translocase protein TatA
MLALFDNLGFSELLVVLGVAILFFGKRLPEVAAEVGTQIAKFRRSLQDIKNETKIDEDLRKIQRDIQSAIPRDLSMGEMARIASAELEKRMRATDGPAPSKPALPEKTESALDASASASSASSSSSTSSSTSPATSESASTSSSSTAASSSTAPAGSDAASKSTPLLSNEESLARGAVVEQAPRDSGGGTRVS